MSCPIDSNKDESKIKETAKEDEKNKFRSKSLTSINTVTSLGFPEHKSPSLLRESENNSLSSSTLLLEQTSPLTAKLATTSSSVSLLDDESFASCLGDNVCIESESHSIPKDVIGLVVVCEQHQTIALKQIVNDCYFLPTFQFDGNSQSLSETVRNVVSMHDSTMLDGNKCLNVKKSIKLD